MATQFVYQRSEIRIIRTPQPKPKDPLSRAETIDRAESGYRITNGNIAAIDFGTTSVTLAYTARGDKENNTLILDPTNKDTRVPNAILLEKKGSSFSIASFGQLAQTQFSKMRSSERSKYIYFERIKMLMKKEKNVHRMSPVESFTGEQFFLVEVIAYILKYLKDTLIKQLAPTARPLKTTDFDWVITVPAIWDARGKRLMREAAYLASLTSGEEGICHLTTYNSKIDLKVPDDINPDKLSLCLEPEGAAIYSQQETVKQVIEAGTPRFQKPEGAYMVLDIGGGTVDITAQVEKDGVIDVLSIPMGNDWGGTQVNEQFSKMFQDIVRDKDFSRYISSGDSSSRRATMNKLLYIEFETQKVTFGEGKHSGDEICVEIPKDMISFYSESKIKSAVSKISGVEFENDTLYITAAVVEEKFFGPPVAGIVDALVSILKDLDQQIDTFYLVGGFGGCKYLFAKLDEAIKKKLGRINCRILVPERPKLAVANGAVTWRKNPDNIKSRKADATYGIDIGLLFNEEKHDPHYRYYNEEQKRYRCRDIFEVFIQKGEIVNSRKVFISRGIIPASQSQTSMLFAIWSTPEVGVQYVKDKEGKLTVTKIGQLVIDLPNPNNLPREKRAVTVEMDFSGTEIQAKAKNEVTGEEVKTVCDFLSAQAH